MCLKGEMGRDNIFMNVGEPNDERTNSETQMMSEEYRLENKDGLQIKQRKRPQYSSHCMYVCSI